MAEFGEAVFIDLGGEDGELAIASAQEALNTLIGGRWPDKSGLAYESAIRMCLMAAAEETSSELAREAFVAAARRAHVLLEPSGRSQRHWQSFVPPRAAAAMAGASGRAA